MKVSFYKSFRSFLLLICTILAYNSYSQETIPTTTRQQVGSFYFMWGYNLDWYTNSTLHFQGSNPNGNYDFKVLHTRAHQRSDMHNFFNTPLTVPQYDLNIGYFFNEKKGWGVEASWNHLKYIMYDNEVRHVTGQIYGEKIDRDTLVSPNFVKFEHTNGNNYLMFSLVKRFVLYTSKNGKFRLSGLSKNGGGVLVPKTDSRILGYHNDGPFKLSGIVIGSTGSMRLDIYKYFFVDTGLQVAAAFYTWGKIYNGTVKHNFMSLQYTYSAGINIPIMGKRTVSIEKVN